MVLLVKNLPVSEGDVRDRGFDPWLGRKWQSTPVFLPGESHGQRRLAGSWWDGKELDTSK